MDIHLRVLIIVLTALIGLCVGSFLNVVIYRLPKNMSLLKPRSHCTKCEYQLKWYENIPLFSYIFLRGKCINCKEKISLRYPLVEFLNMILWILSLTIYTNVIIPTIVPNYLMFSISLIAFSILVCVAFCDYDNMEIPDTFQAILLVLGIISFLAGDAESRVFGFLLGGGFFALFAGIFYIFKKKEGLGFGDIKLMAVLGLLLGFQNTILCILLSSIFGAIILSFLSIKNKKEKNREYPFAVFIVPCAIIAMLIGKFVVNWYLALFGIL